MANYRLSSSDIPANALAPEQAIWSISCKLLLVDLKIITESIWDILTKFLVVLVKPDDLNRVLAPEYKILNVVYKLTLKFSIKMLENDWNIVRFPFKPRKANLISCRPRRQPNLIQNVRFLIYKKKCIGISSFHLFFDNINIWLNYE